MTNENRPFGFEIDFLPVGNGSDSGDAICMRWGYGLTTDNPAQFVMVVDGGYADSGKAMLEHISHYYFQGRTDARIDMMVNTHPHQDHVSGLLTVIEKMKPRWLMMHTPWKHNGLKKWFDDAGNLTEKKIHNKLYTGLGAAVELSRAAIKHGITIDEAFSPWESREFEGCVFYVLSPTASFYDSLLPDFNATPGSGSVDRGSRLEPTGRMLPAALGRLTAEGETSAENESSIILLIYMKEKDRYVLLTSDGGRLALQDACVRLFKMKIDPGKIDLIQVPHHGSVQNLTPAILDFVCASSSLEGQGLFLKKAIASVSHNADVHHPADVVRNEFLRRGVKFTQTSGSTKWFSYGVVPNREEFSSINYDNVPSDYVHEYKVT